MSSLAVTPLWDCVRALYAQPGVADYCLKMQDDQGVDVNLLLFAAWLSVRGTELTEPRLEQAMEVGRGWRASVIVPLRQARRWVKTNTDKQGAEQPCYQTIKAAELEAEKVAIGQLQALAKNWPVGISDTGLGNVDSYLRAAGVAHWYRAAGLLLLRAALQD